MGEFLLWLEEMNKRFPMEISMGYSKITDWCINIRKPNCKGEYPDSKYSGDDAIICDAQSCDVQLAFAMAQYQTKEWFSDNLGGY